LHEKLFSSSGEENLKEKNADIQNDQPLCDRCSFEEPGHAGAARFIAGLHVVTIVVSHTQEIAVIGWTGK
jgi:hypothetical protein